MLLPPTVAIGGCLSVVVVVVGIVVIVVVIVVVVVVVVVVPVLVSIVDVVAVVGGVAVASAFLGGVLLCLCLIMTLSHTLMLDNGTMYFHFFFWQTDPSSMTMKPCHALITVARGWSYVDCSAVIVARAMLHVERPSCLAKTINTDWVSN